MRPTWTNHDARPLRAGGSLRNGHARLPDPVRPPRSGRRLPAPTHRGWWLIVMALLLAGLLAGAARSVRGDELEPTPSPAPTWTAEAAPTEVPRVEPSSRGNRPATQEPRQVLERHFPPDQIAAAERVLLCESRGVSSATGRAGEKGLMQIHPLWQALADQLYGPGADLYDDETNIGTAAAIWRSSGWRPWSCAR